MCIKHKTVTIEFSKFSTLVKTYYNAFETFVPKNFKFN